MPYHRVSFVRRPQLLKEGFQGFTSALVIILQAFNNQQDLLCRNFNKHKRSNANANLMWAKFDPNEAQTVLMMASLVHKGAFEGKADHTSAFSQVRPTNETPSESCSEIKCESHSLHQLSESLK